MLTRRCTVRNAHREMSSPPAARASSTPRRRTHLLHAALTLRRQMGLYGLYCGGWLLGGGDERKGAILRTVAAVVFPAPIQYNQLQKIQDLFCKFTLEYAKQEAIARGARWEADVLRACSLGVRQGLAVPIVWFCSLA